VASSALVHVDAIIFPGCTVLLCQQLWLVQTVAKLAFEKTIVTVAAIGHDGRSGGVGSCLEGILELLPMWIICNGFSIEGRLAVFLGIKVKTMNGIKVKTMNGRLQCRAKIVTNVNFGDTCLV
jgi:hypothetical protein